MSKLPGDHANKGEGLNRHKPSRKRNRKAKSFSGREGNKRPDENVDAIRNPENSNGKAGRRNFGRGNSGFDRNGRTAGSSGNDMAVDATGAGRRDGRPGVGKNTRPDIYRHDNADRAFGGQGSLGRTSGQDRRSAYPGATEKPFEDSGSKSRSKNRNRKRGERGRGRPLNDEERLARSLRQPPQRAPDVAYQPSAVLNSTNDGNILSAKDTAGDRARSPAKHNAKQKDSRSDERGLQGGKRAAEIKRHRVEPYAALDLGTNNCRLLVALPQERGRFRVIDGFSRIVRLGEGLGQSGSLSEEAMDRALDALKICSEKLISHNIRRHRLIATEACRQADNGEVFLERVRNETGMKLEIIDRETEAHLAAEGCGALMDRKADAAVLFDIGGGSSELVLVNRRHRRMKVSEQIVSWTSLPVGVVTLAERHGGKHVDHKVFASMIDEVKEHIQAFEGRDELRRLWKNGRVHLLGTSGTVTTLAGIHLGLARYERRLVDGVWLNAADIDRVVKELLLMNYEQRAASPCIGKERADLVMAGCAILEAIRQTWPSDKLRVADRGLREGILTQMMERDAAWLPAKANRWRRNRNVNRHNRTSAGNEKNGQEA